MDIAVTIVMMIPVILAVALIITVIRKNLTEREAGDPVNITGVIPAVIVLVVAVMIIGSMGAAIAPYSWDEDSGELTINKDVGSGAQEWDSYGTDVKSLILNENVTIVADGAFDTLTGLEYISISDSVESITSSAFGVTLKDYLDQTITAPEAGEYVGTGDGTLYYCDTGIFTYSSNGTAIIGLTSDASAAVNLVIPSKHNGASITEIGASAFATNATITMAIAMPENEIATFKNSAFKQCTSLASVEGFDSLVTVESQGLGGCTSLAVFDFPDTLETIGANGFRAAALTSVELPEGLKTIGDYSLNSLSSATTFSLPSTVTSIGQAAFASNSAVTSVAFASGFAPTLGTNCFQSWTFYDSDGTTTIDKTMASNLAGFTFTGTASALVKQTPVLLGSPEDTEEQELVQPVEEIEETEDTEMLVPEQSETKTAEALSVEETELQIFEMDATEQELASA